MNELELGPRLPEAEQHLDGITVPVSLDHAVAKLPRQGPDLVEIVGRNPSIELELPGIHENGEHADFDALVEILAATRKSQPQSVGKVDMTHEKPRQIIAAIQQLFSLTLP
jgi:hypothetical protein